MVAPSFSVMIPDLTRIAKRQGGVYPAEKVRQISSETDKRLRVKGLSIILPALCVATCGNVLAPARAAELGTTELELVLTRTPDPRNGADLYTICAACHGAKGEGVSDGSVPAVAGQHYSVIAKQIVAFRARLRADPRMVHFSDRMHLSFSQPIADVAAYISRLEPVPSKSPVPADMGARGALRYARACERCHGSLAEGADETQTPGLASQHYEYLIKQLDDAAGGRRSSMADAHATISPRLERDELIAVARYVASLPPATPGH